MALPYAVLVSLCGVPVFPQAPVASFSSKVDLVTVPVVVRDHEGRAVGTLKKEDFQLFDKGKPQVISEFVIEKAEDAAAMAPGAGKPPERTAAGRFVAYLFDDMHLEFANLVRVRAAAVEHLTESLRPGDRAAIYTTSGQNTLDFTSDQEKLRDAINRITPRSRATQNAADCPAVSVYIADLIANKNDATALATVTAAALACMKTGAGSRMMAEAEARAAADRMMTIADADAQTVIGALEGVVQRMSTAPGQRTIVLVSPGFLVTNDHRFQEAEVMDRAIRVHVTVSTLDARGLYTTGSGKYAIEGAQAQGEVLGEVADGTGGTLFHNNDNLLEGFRRTSAFPEFVYVLGFAPQDLKADGSFHGLKVTVKPMERGGTLQSRRGYYAPKHSSDVAEVAKQEFGLVLFSRDELSDIPVALETQFVKTGVGTAKLSVVAHVDMKPIRFEKAEGLNRAKLKLAAAVFDRNGILVGTLEKNFNLSLTDARLEAARAAGVALPLSFDVAPGSYLVRLVLRDGDGLTGARNGAVEIPR